MLHKLIYTILGFGIAFILLPRNANDTLKQTVISGVSTATNIEQKRIAPELASNQVPPMLTAKSALAYDYGSGTVLYSKNLDEKLPIASLTKLMTALVVLDNVKTGDVVDIKKEDQTPYGSVLGLAVGEKITVENLLKGMLIPSANDAAIALASYTGGNMEGFVVKMNDKARSLGLINTKFTNPVGWDIEDNYSTALDLMKIVNEVTLKNNLMRIFETREETIFSVDEIYSHKLVTTNKLLLERSDVIGIKTGFTSKALGNLIIMTDQGDRQLVTIVLGSENREDDTKKLLEWLLTAYKW